MLQKSIVFLATLLFVAGSFMCNKSDLWVAVPPITTNLISNSSFEFNGVPSLQGWVMFLSPPLDTLRDAPTGGGTWSVAIRGVNFLPIPSMRFIAAAPAGSHVYQLSVWGKFAIRAGFAGLNLLRNDTTYPQMGLSINDTTWAWYHALDTLTTINGDSLEVRLSGAYAGLASKTFFDLCKLDVIK